LTPAHQGTGSGTLDIALQKGPPEKWLVIEAKGGSSRRGSRRVGGGSLRAEQGTREYLDSVLAEMLRDPDPQTSAVADDLTNALAMGARVDYVEVRQPLRADGTLGPIRAKKFDIRGVMLELPHHIRFDAGRLRMGIDSADRVIDTLKREAAEHPALFKVAATKCLLGAACATVVSDARICRYLRVGAIAGTAALQSMTGTRSQASIEGVLVAVRRLAPEKMAIGGPDFWRAAFCMAVASDTEWATTGLMAPKPYAAPLANPRLQWDPWSATLNDVLVALYRQDAEVSGLIERLRIEAAARLGNADPAYVKGVLPTLVAVIETLAEPDPTSVDARVEAAVRAHDAYWTHLGPKATIDGLLALELLALARIAHLRGMSPQVDSPYLPRIVFAERCVE
jgi:hypothetical protein